MAVLRALAADPVLGPGDRVLLDLRAAEVTLGVDEAWAVAGFCGAPVGPRGHWVALVVARQADFGSADLVATLAGFHEGAVRVFRSVESALGWLDSAAAHPGCPNPGRNGGGAA
jgi:hypothetical protein